ncbi:MAG: NfeD-like protein [Okeania sp. SIO3B5]|uniref:NfeD-like protein n=1 Tax=Okeania sp. SIO3B5 TaxID=2607811 RepID=UPI0013FFB087|nr:NfeD-like protein [Okeania sp. SIO3B5]NEO54551.1 NfeD-like protein [Okeania sp. SIO3B5]
MKNQLLILAYMSVVVGIFCGILIVLFLSIFRQNQVINSLVSPQDFLGLPCTVEIPFDTHSRGKVSLNVKGSNIRLIARTTEESKEFTKGEQVFIIGTENNQVWVISKSSFQHQE